MDTLESRYSSISKALAWAAVVVWAALIFVASAKSGLDFDIGNGPLELARRWLADVLSSLMGYPVDPSPIGHFSEYLVLGTLLFNALRMNLRMHPSRVASCAIVIAAACAATDEFHQFLFLAVLVISLTGLSMLLPQQLLRSSLLLFCITASVVNT